MFIILISLSESNITFYWIASSGGLALHLISLGLNSWTTKKELAYGVATNSSGNVYVAGMTYGESEENSPSWSNTTTQDPSSGRSNQGLLIMIMAEELPPILRAMSMSHERLLVDWTRRDSYEKRPVLSGTIHPDIKRTIVSMSKRTGMTISQVTDEVLYTGLIEMQELDIEG